MMSRADGRRDAPPPAATAPAPAIASPAYKWTIGLALALLQSAVYFGIGHLHLTRSTEMLRTRLDDAIPFWPWTAWCYLPFYAGDVHHRDRRLPAPRAVQPRRASRC